MQTTQTEQEFLQYILGEIQTRILELNKSLNEGQKEIEQMHEYYWENYTEMDQYGYEDFDNQQALLNQINANQEDMILRQRFRRMYDSPYFGRVDFLYEDEESPETFYIGIGNFAKRAGAMPLIFDWRAPVSSLFYDYDQGAASYEAPAGTMKGEITSKWQYKIRKQKLIYAFESDVKIDDEILGAELGSNGATALKNIVRTIQKEQNSIIRNTKDRILVIQGAAGSGKTSIALHRIAYLLYHDRENLKSSNILILSPNSVFTDYISHILPELGEENIQQMSLDLYAYRQLKDVAPDCEDRYDQIEKELSGSAAEKNCTYKQSLDFLNELEGFALELEDSLMNFRDVNYKGFFLSEAEIIELFYFKFSEIPLLSRMDAVEEYYIDQIETLRDRDICEEEKDIIHQKFQKMYAVTDFYSLYNIFLKSRGQKPLPNLPYEKRKIRYEDVYPILYLKYRLKKQNGNSRIKHLVIDEMQDYSRMQYTILAQMFRCKMTILGDQAQTMMEKQSDVTAFLPKIFGRKARIIRMNKSYRNTLEIAEYANQIAGLREIELFKRHGSPVTLGNCQSKEAALKEVLKNLKTEENYDTAAVICLTAQDAAWCYEYLKGQQEEVSLIDRNSSSFTKGLSITTFYLAKGLEFDQVFQLFPSGKKSPLLNQARYITATRALHELYIFDF